jgi:copper chaperone
MPLLSVPDMSCGHCKASVEAALTPLAAAAPVAVDLANRRVEIGGAAAAAIKALAEIGFPAREITAN